MNNEGILRLYFYFPGKTVISKNIIQRKFVDDLFLFRVHIILTILARKTPLVRPIGDSSWLSSARCTDSLGEGGVLNTEKLKKLENA